MLKLLTGSARVWSFALLVCAGVAHAGPEDKPHSHAVPKKRLSYGLPNTIPADFIERNGFLEYEDLSVQQGEELLDHSYAPAPIASSVKVKSQEIEHHQRADLHKLFKEAVYAKLPLGSKIIARSDAEGRVHWEYPVNFTVAHAIWFKTEPAHLFELRIVKRVYLGGRTFWAYGTYSPKVFGEKGDDLYLNRYEGFPFVKLALTLPEISADRKSELSFNRLGLNSCQSCHAGNSPAAYQYEVLGSNGKVDLDKTQENTGPCGFVPNNPNLGKWFKAYEAKYHVNPIENR